MKYVYHGSRTKNLKTILRVKSTHQQEWVYATKSKAIATIFISNSGSDLNYYLGGKGTIEEPVILVERKKGMFESIFNISGSLYTLNDKNFIEGKTGWSAEVISEFDENVVKEEIISNVFEKLCELESEREIIIFRYPNRPNFIPLDNSDLIPKVINWYKKGINIEPFFELYPELKTKYINTLKEEN